LELRRLNLVRGGDLTLPGERWEDPPAGRVLAALPPAPAGSQAGGIGYAMGEKHIGGGRSGARLTLDDDGALTLVTGAVDPGTGTLTILQQMVAGVFGRSLRDVRVVNESTPVAPFDSGSAATRVTHVAGRATLGASEQLRDRLVDLAGDQLDAPRELLTVTETGIGVGEAVLTWTELAALAVKRTGTLPTVEVDYSAKKPEEPVFSAARAEVLVDFETGTVKVVRLDLAQDAGCVLNPLTASGQVEGAAIQALGMALGEELVREGGVTISTNLDSYRIPAAGDVPEVQIHWVEQASGPGPHHAKPVGEACLIPVAAAIANAVADAIGAPVTELPLTPERVLATLRASRR
jgi:putative selenate reductase molybdopterin-binding subunit